jgi:hypothetical protein
LAAVLTTLFTILSNGSVQYEGRFYVAVEGVRKQTIRRSDVHWLIRTLEAADFFHWEVKNYSCLDLPEVHITATLNGQRKQVLEDCNSPGKVLDLAEVIDEISGANRWVHKRR